MRAASTLIATTLSGICASLLLGLLIAAWTFAVIAPPLAAPAIARDPARVDHADDAWREANYARIGLWREEARRAEPQASGSSRL